MDTTLKYLLISGPPSYPLDICNNSLESEIGGLQASMKGKEEQFACINGMEVSIQKNG